MRCFRSVQSSTPTRLNSVKHPHTYADNIISGQNNNHISTTLRTRRTRAIEVPAVSALSSVLPDSAAKSWAHMRGCVVSGAADARAAANPEAKPGRRDYYIASTRSSQCRLLHFCSASPDSLEPKCAQHIQTPFRRTRLVCSRVLTCMSVVHA